MRLSFLCLTLLLLPAMARADDNAAAKPSLTPEEIAQGWILLFDGETKFGWKTTGTVDVKDGAIVVGGDEVSSVSPTTFFGNFNLRMETEGTGGGNLVFKGKHGQTTAGLSADKSKWDISVQAGTGGQGISVSGEGTINGVSQRTVKVDYNTTDPVSFQMELTPGSKFTVKNVKLKPLGLESIFNGKDLTGWAEIPGKKSKFTVTDKGELNVKNGNGDLQSTGQWDDFVLQIDVFSNGPHLNSGVFFRCLPGEFWSGYEAQIRNQWQGDDRTKAVDYGTGGIYNRQPARKVVSSDKEWFTMTVAANGKHLAVWVNGYQTADFTDERPPDRSARKGSKTDAGPISLQGHDATTDLSFRNIKIAAVPKEMK